MPSRRKLWADSLPKSPNTGVALTDNRRFNPDGSVQSKRENEDGYFNCVFNSTSLLMVLDGHDGRRAQEYVKETMPELIVKMVEDTVNHEEIRTKFGEIFQTVEKGFFHSIDELLTERAIIKMELDECLNSSVALDRYPNHVNRMSELDDQIKGGTTAAVAVIKHNKLYVANVGDTRVLLCMVNPQNNYLLVDQLTVDHNTSNEEELQRLKLIGLDPERLRRAGRLGTQQNTRCIGDFNIKNGYADHDILRSATKPPGIAVPYVTGPVPISQARGFIIVMSDGLYDAWSAFTDKNSLDANIAIVGMVVEQMGKHQSLEAVAQTVIDSVVSSVKSTYARSQKSECRRLDDITLMIHNLGYNPLECPLQGIVSFPLATTPVPSVHPPMNTYFSQPGGIHQGQAFDSVHQPGSHYNPPMHHMQSYDPRYIASLQFPPRGQAPMNYYTPTPAQGYHPTGENPFVFPNPQQPVSHVTGLPLPPKYTQPSGQERPGYMPTNQSHHSVMHHSISAGNISPSGYGAANQSSGYNQSSNYNNSYSSNMPADGSIGNYSNHGMNYGGNVPNASLPNPQHHVLGRRSTSPLPPNVDYRAPQSQVHPQQLQPHPQQVQPHPQQVQPHPQQVQFHPQPAQQASGNRSGSSTHFSTSDEEGEATPIAEPVGKELFPTDQSGKKPVPRPRTKVLGDNLSTLTKVSEQPSSTSGVTEIPPPQSASTPKKESDGHSHTRDSLDASNLKDDELYDSGKETDHDDTMEAPLPGSGETVELVNPVESQPPLPDELAKSSEGNQLDHYIFDSDGEMEKQLSGHPPLDDDDEDDDEDMGVVDPSMLSSELTGEGPAQNIVCSYIKFDDSFPDIEYDAL